MKIDGLNEDELKQNPLDVVIFIDVIIKEPKKIKDIEGFKKYIQDSYTPYEEEYKAQTRDTHGEVYKPLNSLLFTKNTIGSKIASYLASRGRNTGLTLQITSELNFIESGKSPSDQVEESVKTVSQIL